ncbi:MAG: hypothetical protein Q7S69_10630 [Nitrosomonadaceae bacterium]|nr:hypothetical protein [Nitrosomonadaceae bacterium]
MNPLLTAIKNQITRLGSTLLFGGVFLTTWVFRKITRRQAGISFNAALILLLVAILLVPFAMNYTAHLLAGN